MSGTQIVERAPSASMTLAEYQAADGVVRRGLRAYIEVGRALRHIHDGHGYRHASFATFEAYIRARLDASRSHGYRLIDAAEVAAVLSPIGDTPANETQARALVPVLRQAGPQAVVDLWTKLRAEHGVDRLTAARIERGVGAYLAAREAASRPPWRELCPLCLKFELGRLRNYCQECEARLDPKPPPDTRSDDDDDDDDGDGDGGTASSSWDNRQVEQLRWAVRVTTKNVYGLYRLCAMQAVRAGSPEREAELVNDVEELRRLVHLLRALIARRHNQPEHDPRACGGGRDRRPGAGRCYCRCGVGPRVIS